jgi:DNA (cytosine-5)-methyltransferase 1
MLWFNKSRRAKSADDYETWVEGGVVPTLNAFDSGDVRATTVIVVRMREGKPGGGKGPLMSEDRSLTLATANDQTLFVFYGNRVDDVRIQDGKINTLQARMGTGGNNMPMVAHPIQGNMIGRSDTAGPAGKGYGDTDDPMFSLTSTDRHAIAGGMLVRRLTPLECERLQGFPDGWTEGQSDTHRYKQMGNAVAVPVVEWIISGIVDTIENS